MSGPRQSRAGSLVLIALVVAMTASTAVFTWLRATLPSEPAFISADLWDWNAAGVVVLPIGDSGPFVAGDRVTAIDGVPMERLANEALDLPARSSSPPPTGAARFSVARSDRLLEFDVALVPRPIGGLLASGFALLTYTVVQAAVAFLAWLRRPGEGWRRGFLVGSVANIASAVVWELGLRPTDFMRPEPMLFLFAINAPLHLLFWSSIVHVMTSWPLRARGFLGTRSFLVGLYVVPQLAVVIGMLATAVFYRSTLAWLGSAERVLSFVILGLIVLVLVVLVRAYGRATAARGSSVRIVVGGCIAGALAVGLLTVLPMLLTGQALAPRGAVAALGLPLAVILLVGTLRSSLFEVDLLLASRRRLVVAREEERRRIRRELHDGIGPMLAAMTLKADLARDVVGSDPEAAGAAIDALKADTQAALAEIRRLTRELRPPALDELGVVEAVRQRAVELGQGSGEARVQITVTEVGPLPALDAAVEVAAYRIAVEAMTNVVRHAGARHCRVRLARGPDLTVEVADDGAGFADGRGAGVGMTSMRERCAELGGTLVVERTEDGWTVVRATLPGVGTGGGSAQPARPHPRPT